MVWFSIFNYTPFKVCVINKSIKGTLCDLLEGSRILYVTIMCSNMEILDIHIPTSNNLYLFWSKYWNQLYAN